MFEGEDESSPDKTPCLADYVTATTNSREYSDVCHLQSVTQAALELHHPGYGYDDDNKKRRNKGPVAWRCANFVTGCVESKHTECSGCCCCCCCLLFVYLESKNKQAN